MRSGVDHWRMKRRFAQDIPVRSTAFARTSVMSEASGMLTGQTVSHALQPMQSACSCATLSIP